MYTSGVLLKTYANIKKLMTKTKKKDVTWLLLCKLCVKI